MLSILFVLSNSFTFFFFNDTATTEIYTLSLHDALPISRARVFARRLQCPEADHRQGFLEKSRSEEHTSELQSRQYLVCRLLLEKKKTPQRLKLSYTKTTVTFRSHLESIRLITVHLLTLD